ncbi:hypothetical protein DVH24_004602 [Malus domestica]|uniref:Uncharacterized protein n=1 Tax=Malus domestica TaxID=3750 RepID=A0A498IAB2_MALDO|nr:hypothetical protein DVH24_004602 [Malus domestica]
MTGDTPVVPISADVTSRPGVDHFPGLLHHCSTILSTLSLPFPYSFVFGKSRATSQWVTQWVTHPGSVLAFFSLNFRVTMEPGASELLKGLVLGRDGNIHLRITLLGDWVTHLGSALASFSLNFEVLTKPEANELPKCLVLSRDENIHLRITPLGDVGCYS